MSKLLTRDKKGRAIHVGDVLKVYHFTAALRREKWYMYKWVVGKTVLGKGSRGAQYFKVNHLGICTDTEEYYHMGAHEGIREDIEIVQSAKYDHRDRPTIIKTLEQPNV